MRNVKNFYTNVDEDGAGFLSSEQHSSTMMIVEQEGGDQQSRTNSRRTRCVTATLVILAAANTACFVWIAITSAQINNVSLQAMAPIPGQHNGPDLQGLVRKIEALEHEIKERVFKEAMPANHSSFAAVRKGYIRNGVVFYNETLYSAPEDSFSASNGTFTVPKTGTYSFSFSGTSLCSETKVMPQVNNQTVLRYYDRHTEWKGNSSAYGYYRGWTQNFALQLDVGDMVSLLVDCDSSEASWTHHEPGVVKEHNNHYCFYNERGYFYFLGQFMG